MSECKIHPIKYHKAHPFTKACGKMLRNFCAYCWRLRNFKMKKHTSRKRHAQVCKVCGHVQTTDKR